MGLLDALIYGLRDVFDNDDNQLPRRSRIKYTTTITDDPENDRLVVDTGGGGGGGSPSSPDKTVQTNQSGAFKSLEYFTREANGTLNVGRHELTGWPELIFTTSTITRSSGSWITDGFANGPIQISNIASPYQTANNGIKTVTNVSATVLTVSDTLTVDDIAADDTFDLGIRVEQGGHISYGLPTDTFPNIGDHRVARPAEFQPDHVLVAGVNDSDEYVEIITVAKDGEALGIGGSLTNETTSAGTTKRWAVLALFANFLESRSLRHLWRFGANVLRDEGFDTLVTTNATPDTLTVPSLLRGVVKNVELTAKSASNSAVWRWEDLPDGTSTLTLENHSAGAAAWTASRVSSTITATGAAFTNISWQLTVRGA